MSKFIPYQKLTKKQQRAMDREKRGSWGQVKPITRCPARSDAYNRSKENCRWQPEAHQEHRGHGVLLVRAFHGLRGVSGSAFCLWKTLWDSCRIGMDSAWITR